MRFFDLKSVRNGTRNLPNPVSNLTTTQCAQLCEANPGCKAYVFLKQHCEATKRVPSCASPPSASSA